MQKLVNPIHEVIGIDGNTYVYGTAVNESSETVIYELQAPIAITTPAFIAFTAPPTTTELTIEGLIKMGGPIPIGAQCPILWLTDGVKNWKKVSAPLYLLIKQGQGTNLDIALLRARSSGSWVSALEDIGIPRLHADDTIEFKTRIRPGTINATVNNFALHAKGLSEPFGELVLQVGHKDTKSDDIGDEELPPGSYLNNLRIIATQ